MKTESALLIEKLKSKKQKEKESAASELGDMIRCKNICKEDAPFVANSLLAALDPNDNKATLDEVLESLACLTDVFYGSIDAEWSLLTKTMDHMDNGQIEIALGILGNTLDRKHLQFIKLYMEHDAGNVVRAAFEAENEILWTFTCEECKRKILAERQAATNAIRSYQIK